ncbi:MAG: hypothetical protein NTY38_32535 [Acidobacteria bacterium]|nr:hypothetical protein [Acidobacteriota bacterium]
MPNRNQFLELLADSKVQAFLLAAATLVLGYWMSDLKAKVGWQLLASVVIVELLIVLAVLWVVYRPLKASIDSAFVDIKRYLEPKSISWLLDTEQLVGFEEQSQAKEIWLLTSDLVDDLVGGPFQDLVGRRLTHTKYVYLVPNTPEIYARVQLLQAHYKNSQNLQFHYLPDSFFFLVPKLDIVIYNPLSAGKGERCAYMGIPASGDINHYHAAVSTDFIDKLVGVLVQQAPTLAPNSGK